MAGVFVVSISLYGIYFISWTVNAALYGTSSVGLILVASKEQKIKEKYMLLVVSMLLLGMASLVRFASFKAVLPFVVVVFAYFIIRCIKDKDSRIAVVGMILFVALSIGTMCFYEKYDASHKMVEYETEEYAEFATYRSYYSDYPTLSFDENEEFYESIGWDRELYYVTKNWCYIDERFNTENLKLIVESSKQERNSINTENRVSDALNYLWNAMQGNQVWSYMTWLIFGGVCISFLGVVVCAVRRSQLWLEWMLALETGMLALAEIIYLCLKGRYIFRAFMCAALPALVIVAWVIFHIMNKFHNKKIYILILLVGLIGSFSCLVKSSVQMFDSEQREKRDKDIQICETAEEIFASNPDNLYIYDTSIISGTNLFLDMSLRGCRKNALFYGGTGVYSSAYYAKIANFGYDEFHSENLFDENVYMISTDSYMESSIFMSYMKKKFGDYIRVDLAEQTNGVYVYKFVRLEDVLEEGEYYISSGY
jgi:hypothetical protein